MLIFCYMFIRTVWILYYHSHLEKTFLIFSKWPPERFHVQYYNMASFPVWIRIKYG